MFDELKPYPDMRDSGVRCLGKVPAHWNVRRLRNIAEMRISNVDKHTKEGERPVRLCNYVDVYKNDRIRSGMDFIKATATMEEVKRFRLRSRDVLITKDSEAWNDIGVPAFVQEAEDDVVSGYHLALLRSDTRHLDGEFLFRALQSEEIAYQLHVQANGVTRYGLSHNAIKSVQLPAPPLPEQAAIARFLDHADRRIQRCIRAKEKLIALLEEQKQAVIHEAVTGRIDVRTGRPYLTYKDSGVEWLVEVPAHWEVWRLRNIAEMRVSNIDKHTRENEHPVRLCNYVDVYKNDYIHSGMTFMKATAKVDEVERFRLRSRDVLITKDSEAWNDIGVPALVQKVEDDVVSGYHLALLRSDTRQIDGEFLFRALQSREVAHQLHVRANGVTRYGLSHNAIKSVSLPVPPRSEQTTIVRFLDHSIISLNEDTNSARRQIALLHEYRTRLIADVVTGKLDVREAAAALPEVGPFAADDPDDHAEAGDAPMSGTGTEAVEGPH